MTVEQGRVGPVAQQQRADLRSVFRCGLVERGELPQVHGVDARSVLKEGTVAQKKDSTEYVWK